MNIIETVYADNATHLDTQFGFGYFRSMGEVFNKLITPGFEIAGTAVVFYFVLGAFKYVRSGGDKESVASARKMITHAIIGFILLIFMFLILQFVPEFLGLKGYKIIE